MLCCTLTACDPNTKDARRFIRVAERMVDTHPDSTLLLIDSVMGMEARLSDKERMEMALLQGKALYGGSLCPDDRRSTPATAVPLPELDYAADYFSEKGKTGKAALAALYCGHSNLEAGGKIGAMQSFKKAEQYGNETGDSLTVARARYYMGKILYDDGNKEEALAMLRQADQAFGDHYAERAMTQNVMAAVYILLSDFVSAEECLNQALGYAELGSCDEAMHKALNNYAVLYRLVGDYDMAKDAVRRDGALSDESRRPRYYMNMGNICFVCGQMDSAGYYYLMLDTLLPKSIIDEETKSSAYHALSRYAENRGDYQKALEYRSQYDKHLSIVYDERIQNNEYATEKRYDYERIRQSADQEMIRNQRIVSALVALLMVLVLATLFIYFRLIQKKLKEAETKALLLKMLNQNSNLQKDNEEKKEENRQLTETITTLLAKRLKTMQKLDVFMKDRKNSTSLTDLEKLVFDGNNHIDMDGKTLTVGYGIDRQRVVQTLDDGNTRRTKRYFTPLYETVTENGSTEKIHYLTSVSGLFAIFVKSSSPGIMHYTLKDHQGSLAATVHGNTVERLNYDPWGRRRNTTDFGYDNVSHTFDRGYTLHEHYDGFGLINMNGRLTSTSASSPS